LSGGKTTILEVGHLRPKKQIGGQKAKLKFGNYRRQKKRGKEGRIHIWILKFLGIFRGN